MPTALAIRPWLPEPVDDRVTSTLNLLADRDVAAVEQWLQDLVVDNQRIHDQTCVNLNPATNRMNPRAEQMLAARLGSRPSLGYPGEKYEMGLERSNRSRSSPPSSPPGVNDAELAQRIEAIAYSGLNRQLRRREDRRTGPDDARLDGLGGGQAAAARLRRANLLACGIGLPIASVGGDLNGLRLGTPEVARVGMTPADMPELALFITRALRHHLRTSRRRRRVADPVRPGLLHLGQPHRPTAIERRLSFRPAELGQRKLVKNSAMSFANSSGCSAAAKCPPLR